MKELGKLRVPVDAFYRAIEDDNYFTYESIMDELGLTENKQVLFVTSTTST